MSSGDSSNNTAPKASAAVHGGDAFAGVLTYKPNEKLQVGGGKATSAKVSLNDLIHIQKRTGVPFLQFGGAEADGAVLTLDEQTGKDHTETGKS